MNEFYIRRVGNMMSMSASVKVLLDLLQSSLPVSSLHVPNEYNLLRVVDSLSSAEFYIRRVGIMISASVKVLLDLLQSTVDLLQSTVVYTFQTS
jgi:hypothetical protein